MELAQILRTLWSHKLELGLAVIAAVALALLTTHRVASSPFGLEKRSLVYGAAEAQILIDSPRSSLIDLEQETPPLATRAAVFAQFLRSNTVGEAIARHAGVPARDIVAQGPFTTLDGRQNITRPSEARSNEVREEGDRLRLVFDHAQDLPIVSVYSQAPTADLAVRLADSAGAALSEYVNQQEVLQEIPRHRRTVVRELGPAEGGWVNAGVNPVFMVLAFAAALVAGCLLILGVDALRRALRSGRAPDQATTGPDSAAADVSKPAGPAEDELAGAFAFYGSAPEHPPAGSR